MKNPFFNVVLAAGLAIQCHTLWAADPVVPGNGFDASSYQALWLKSPFAVASDVGVEESPDFSLKGVAQFDGIFYASLVDKRSSGPEPEHFLLSSDNPVKGLTLVSITRGRDAASTTATIQRNGQIITLKLDVADTNPPNGLPATNSATQPNNSIPQTPISGMYRQPNGVPPRVLIRHPIITIPQNPQQPVPPPAPR